MSSLDAAPETEAPRTSRWLRGHVPGEPGIWFFIAGDMIVFAIFFAVFLVARMKDPALFAASRRDLTTGLGVLNTVLLLTSSLVVALGVGAFRQGARRSASVLFTVAMGCAVGFLAVKIVEYSTKLSAGITPTTNDFFLYYFIFTGVHAVHVVIGLVGLTIMRLLARRARPGPNDLRTIEVGASFWHMVDLLWIVLFPLFYLAS